MENPGDLELRNLVAELTEGKELTQQLQIQLSVSSSLPEARQDLVHRILSSYDHALSLLKYDGSTSGETQSVDRYNSPRSHCGSPHVYSDDSDRDSKDPDHKHASRKRKGMPRWTKTVQVCPSSGLEGQLDDGHSWRKYGQKDILGAKYPRGYYKCSHRPRGCLATKQVQRSDEDPFLYHITYKGNHTCTPGKSTSNPAPQCQPDEEQPNNFAENTQHIITQTPQNTQELLLSFQTGRGMMITQDTDNQNLSTFQSFDFPSSSNYFLPNVDGNNFPENYFHSSVSPVSSGSDFFGNLGNSFGGNPNAYNTSECELTGVVPGATSAANPTTLGLDHFSFDQTGFNNSGFGNPGGFFP